jgi:hypothetical protein
MDEIVNRPGICLIKTIFLISTFIPYKSIFKGLTGQGKFRCFISTICEPCPILETEFSDKKCEGIYDC